jgi:hypothetical protein
MTHDFLGFKFKPTASTEISTSCYYKNIFETCDEFAHEISKPESVCNWKVLTFFLRTMKVPRATRSTTIAVRK